MTRPYTKRSPIWEKISANPERTQEMVDRYVAGQTLQQIGDHYGITRERVRQLISREGITRHQGGHHLRALEKHKQLIIARNERWMRRVGMNYADYRAVPQKAKAAYQMQRKNAQQREIPFLFTFAEWWALWLKSGKWAQRGVNGYVMCRKGDVGPYSAENIYIATARQNIQDYYARRRREAA